MEIVCTCKDTFKLVSTNEKKALFQCPSCRKSFSIPVVREEKPMKLVSITLEESLLNELERRRKAQSVKEGKYISRSSYIRKALRLALGN